MGQPLTAGSPTSEPLQNSIVVLNTSAYAYHHDLFDYDRIPLAPLGCAVQFCVKPSRCSPGASIPLMGGKSTHHPNTIAQITFVSRPHALTVYQTPFTLNTNIVLNPQLLRLMQS